MHKGMFFLATFFAMGSWSTAVAVEGPTLELGKTLFESTELGTAERSCSNCHPGGKGLEGIKPRDDATIKQTINRCIRNAQGGEVLDTGSQEMEALLNYIKVISDE